ncbi:MAG TPA: fused MFS/spermidine synthase, partial [Kofleriaceae bacterium]|nr:fused MFS/spermidine synthase [Kofleriaceae bacterium]
MPALLVICFTLSGATSLVLQVVWARQLTEVFGSSSLAIATVLATFMGGLALGAHLGGRLADRMTPGGARASAGGTWRARLADPLLGYAIAESIVGVSALLIPLVIAGYRELAPGLWLQLGDSPIALGLVRLAGTAAVLLVPTTAMGATLPLLGRHVTRRRGDVEAVGRRLGALYAANTTGALCGAASAGFWLIPAIGVTSSSRLAALAALALAAVVALAATRRTSDPLDAYLDALDQAPEPATVPAATATAPATPAADADADDAAGAVADAGAGAVPADPPSRDPLLLLAYGASGAAAMALEVLFSRALGIVLGSSVYSFTLVLVAFLLGLAAGAAIAAHPAARARRPATWLALLFLAIAIAVLLAHLLIDELPALLVALLEGTALSIRTLLGIHLALAGLVILPVALGLGAVLPLVMRCYVGDLDRVGRDVGRAYAANTIGAIAGSLSAGFVVLPLLGLEAGLRLCAALQAALAALVLLHATRAHRRRAPRALLAAA